MNQPDRAGLAIDYRQRGNGHLLHDHQGLGGQSFGFCQLGILRHDLSDWRILSVSLQKDSAKVTVRHDACQASIVVDSECNAEILIGGHRLHCGAQVFIGRDQRQGISSEHDVTNAKLEPPAEGAAGMEAGVVFAGEFSLGRERHGQRITDGKHWLAIIDSTYNCCDDGYAYDRYYEFEEKIEKFLLPAINSRIKEYLKKIEESK